MQYFLVWTKKSLICIMRLTKVYIQVTSVQNLRNKLLCEDDLSVWFVLFGIFFWEFLMSCSPHCFWIGLLYHHDTCSMIPDIMIYFRSRKNLPLSSLCLGKIAFNPMGALQTARTCLGANVFCCLLITNECPCHGEPCVYWFNAGLQWMLWP